MAGTLRKIVNITNSVNNLSKLIANVTITQNHGLNTVFKTNNINNLNRQQLLLIHTTAKQHATPEEKKKDKPEAKKAPQFTTVPGLTEFFDDHTNWGLNKIKTGRSWTKDELRLKSNEDLHKLWFVLLKERNMLLTMERACNDEIRVFPNPERIDKVEDSMENLENVVRERNQAYYMLETGEHGERPSKMTTSPLGLQYWYRMREYKIPRFLNKQFNETNCFSYGGYAVRKFRHKYFEKMYLKERARYWWARKRAARYFKNFPNVDPEAILKELPQLTKEDLEQIKEQKSARGHVAPS